MCGEVARCSRWSRVASGVVARMARVGEVARCSRWTWWQSGGVIARTWHAEVMMLGDALRGLVLMVAW